MDQVITEWINAPAGGSPWLDAIMIALTRYGLVLLLLLVVLQWWSTHDRLHIRHACVAAGISFLAGLGFNQIILLVIHRIRPYDAGVSHLIIDRSADWSFPSDHTTATFAIALSFVLCGLKLRGRALLVGALLVCVSRVYVGTHYAADVLGGAATGALAAVVGHSLYREGTRFDRWITRVL